MDRSEPDAVKEECCRENEELLVGRELLQEQLLQQRFAELELQVQESREKASVAEQAKIEKEREVLDLQTHITKHCAAGGDTIRALGGIPEAGRSMGDGKFSSSCQQPRAPRHQCTS